MARLISGGLSATTSVATRRALPVLALGLVSFVLGACSPGPAASPQRPGASEPAPSLASGSQAEGAKFLLDAWFAALNSTQQSGDGTKFLKMQIDPPDWRSGHETAILSGGETTDPLQVNFLGGQLDGLDSPSAHKLIGMVQFNNVHIASGNEIALSDADKANGFSYMASYKIAFIARIYRRFQEPASATGKPDRATVESWLHEAVTLDSMLLSSWSEANVSRRIGVKDGTWGDLTNRSASYACGPSDPACFKEFDIPFGDAPALQSIVFGMYGCSPIDVQGYDAKGSPVTQSCQIENVNLGP